MSLSFLRLNHFSSRVGAACSLATPGVEQYLS